LNQNRQLQARVALEPEWQYDHDSVTGEVTTLLARAQQTLFAVNFMQVLLMHHGAAMPPPAARAFGVFQQAVARQLNHIAEQIETCGTVSGAHSGDLLLVPLAALDRLLARADPAHSFSRQFAGLVSAAHAVHERIRQLT